MALETNLNEKRKRKKKPYLCSRWLGGLPEPASSSPSHGLGRAAFFFPASLPRPRGPAQEPLLSRAFSYVSLMSGPRMSAAPLLPLVVTEPETNTTATETNRVSRDLLPKNVVVEL
jgi:hypothetical protein